MQEHVHTGIVTGAVVIVYWVIGFNLLKYAAIHLSTKPGGEWLSKTIGSLISTGAA